MNISVGVTDCLACEEKNLDFLRFRHANPATYEAVYTTYLTI
jgi:hypothetical protein